MDYEIKWLFSDDKSFETFGPSKCFLISHILTSTVFVHLANVTSVAG